MHYLWWSLLAVFVGILLIATVVIWHHWTLFLHVYDKKLMIELRGFGFRRQIFYRDFSKQNVGTGGRKQGKSTREKKEKPKKNGFSERLEKDKKRIYNKEKGGYQHSGLLEVLGEYRAIYRQSREVIHAFLEDTRHRVTISFLWIRLDFGTGNPAHTGMLYGTIWNLVGLGYPFLVRYFKAAYPRMEVTPDFYHPRFDLEIKSIIKVRPAHIINAIWKQARWSILTYVKQYFTKGSVKHG